MQLLKSLLNATIKYQDAIDEKNFVLREKMLDLAEQAKEKYPKMMREYNFLPQRDIQDEFDNLQKFINDFSNLNDLVER